MKKKAIDKKLSKAYLIQKVFKDFPFDTINSLVSPKAIGVSDLVQNGWLLPQLLHGQLNDLAKKKKRKKENGQTSHTG